MRTVTSTSPDHFVRRATAVGAFRRRRGLWPSPSASDPDEQRLGKWLTTQRNAARGCSDKMEAAPERLSYLHRVAPGWLTETAEDIWRESAVRVGAFHQVRGRWPEQTAVNETEKRLGAWLDGQRVAARGKPGKVKSSSERRAYLDQVAPGWRGPDPEAIWRRSADSAGQFHTDHGRWPELSSPDLSEGQLARWLAAQRYSAKRRPSTARTQYLDRVAPGWNAAGRDASWKATADKLVDHIATTGAWPSMRTGGTDEKRLAGWLQTQRRADREGTGPLVKERSDHLDRVAPGWRGEDAQAAWVRSADQVGEHVQVHGRWPSLSGASEQERTLARWLGKQRTGARRGLSRSTPERRAYLDQVAPGWLASA